MAQCVIYSPELNAYQGSISYVADPRFADHYYNSATAKAFCQEGEYPVEFSMAPDLS